MFLAAFIAGFVSFLSPCVIPLISSFMAYLAGTTTAMARPHTMSLLKGTLSFILGFTVVFVALGSFASGIGYLLLRYQTVLNVITGLVVVLMGLYLMGILPFSISPGGGLKGPPSGSGFVLGLSFALVWTPCTGPILGSVLMIAGTQGTVAYGALLLLIYSMGLALPFLITAVLWSRYAISMRRLGPWAYWLNRIAGVILLVLGFLIMSGRLHQLVSFFS